VARDVSLVRSTSWMGEGFAPVISPSPRDIRFPPPRPFSRQAPGLLALSLHDASALMCCVAHTLCASDGRKINKQNIRKFGTWEATRTDFRTDSDEKPVHNMDAF
jgi:hypothetical protein